MRTAFIKQLIVEAGINPNIFLLVGDLGFSVVEPFAEKYPERFLNVGIAEQNMAGIAAGLAIEGYCVYIYSIGNFPTLRCMEQIRYDICYHNLNVKIVAVGGGYAYGSLGASHHATEELGMLRIIPNLVVCAPGDPYEARYIRIGKAGEPLVHSEDNFIKKLEIGEIMPVRKSANKMAVFSTGAMLEYVVDFLDVNNISSSVYSFPFIKPINKHLLVGLFKKYKSIITIEEHQASGGFGSAILEILNDLSSEGLLQNEDLPAIRRIAIRDKFYSIAGSQEYLRAFAGIELKGEYFSNDSK